jgi:3-hydroxyisobutyrate dehydrogenase-like beta-hydroxyacid dehydrogenase
LSGDGRALRVGFAGLGSMGRPMALNLLRAGFPLSVYNRTAERSEPLRAAGAQVMSSPRELGASSDVVVTMLTDGEAVASVLLGDDGVVDPSGSGTVVDMSTIGPKAAVALAEEVRARGWAWVDAPVSGSTALAEAASLTTMVGAEPGDFERVEPVLEAMTASRYRLGGPGAGAAMKLALNLLIASSSQAISEALVLAERIGIGRAVAYEVIANSAVSSPFVAYKRAAFMDPDAEPVGFSLGMMQKDLDLALGLAREHCVPLLAGAAAREGMTVAGGLCGGDEDLVRMADALRAIAVQREREVRK